MIDYILFDMDNTLYPESSGLGPAMRDRMNAFTADFLKVSPERAQELRRKYLPVYGTTLRWLQQCHGLEAVHRFMDEVHPKNIHAYIGKNPGLRRMIEDLPVGVSVLTNSPPEHAERILSELGIEDLFDHVFDITFNDYNGKPYESCFTKVLSTVAMEAHQVLLVDDVPDYLIPFRDLGGQILLMDETGRHRDSGLPSIREILELPDYLMEHQLISFQR
ncbi:MAG: HAD-IA family hydrolase [Spirochaetales bacterium]|nr:HAD-IA family hydrolase [Spirochaetales bacterium]